MQLKAALSLCRQHCSVVWLSVVPNFVVQNSQLHVCGVNVLHTGWLKLVNLVVYFKIDHTPVLNAVLHL